MAVSGFGTVYIQLDQGSYSPGQQVNGTVFLSVTQNIPGGSELWLNVAGMEQTKVIQRKTKTTSSGFGKKKKTRTHTYYVTHHDLNSFFDHKFPIYRFEGGFVPAGQYTFPVSFLLQPNLPSTFNYEFFRHGSCFARVNYVIQATVGANNGSNLPPITCNQAFIVNQELLMSSGVQKKELNKNIKSCCCIDKGDTKIVSYFEKNDYVPGETAYTVTEADNSKGKADVKLIESAFQQVLSVTAKFHTEVVIIDHQKSAISGIKAGEILLGPNAKRLDVALRTQAGELIQPTCRGRLVKNEYRIVNTLRMDANLCCETDPACEIILNVRNADMNYQKWAEMPSNWNPQVMSGINIMFTADYANPAMLLPDSLETEHIAMPPGPVMTPTPWDPNNQTHGVELAGRPGMPYQGDPRKMEAHQQDKSGNAVFGSPNKPEIF